MRFGILGPLVVADEDGLEIDVRGPQVRALLAVLLLHPNEVLVGDRLVELLRDGEAPPSAVKAVHVLVSRLRRALGPAAGRVVTVGGGYRLVVLAGELDRERFEGLAGEAERLSADGEWVAACAVCDEALSLWRGEPLCDFAYASFAQGEIGRLSELRMGVLERRIDARLALGEDQGVVGELEALVYSHPFRERLRGQLMVALYRAGRQADALAAFQDARRDLVEELGIEPSAELRGLHERILGQDPELSRSAHERAASTPGFGDAHADGHSASSPVGMVAMLFTDIEGSTRLAAGLGAGWPAVLSQHGAILSAAIAAEGGHIEVREGDSFFATFTDPTAAARAAIAAQRGLRAHHWPPGAGEVRVRMGLHVGHIERVDGQGVGLEIHRAARVAAAAHGGQLLLTAAARELAGDAVASELIGMHRLKDFPMPVQLYCAVIDGEGAAAFPPPRTESVRPTNLPAASKTLVGRDSELSEVCEAFLVGGERLVTITGRGGAGKTSLALVAGARLLDEHPGGVWWVNLTTVASTDQLATAIASVLGADRDPELSPVDAIERRLRNSGPTLVIADNMEHLLDGTAVLCGLLDALPELRVLVTSQIPVRADLELVVALNALDEDHAIELIDRVRYRRDRHHSLGDGDRQALLEIVELLDGLPLALELAAARLAVLTPIQLRDRLRASLDVLADTRGNRPERQRSLRATLDWTLSQLEPQARTLFVRLGVFAGPVDIGEIEHILTGDDINILDAIATLLDAALLRRVETGDGSIRLGLPEALRQIAAEQLDSQPDAQRWRAAHARRQHDIVWAARTALVSKSTYRVARDADAEIAAALRWAWAMDEPLAVRIGAAYASLIVNTGRTQELLELTERLLAASATQGDMRSLALFARTVAMIDSGRCDDALKLSEEAQIAAVHDRVRCLASIGRGLSCLWAGQVSAAVEHHARATDLARATGDAPALAGALLFEAQALIAAHAFAEADDCLRELEAVGRHVDARALDSARGMRAELALGRGRPLDALEPTVLEMEQHEAAGEHILLLFGLESLAVALAQLGLPSAGLEVLGMADALRAELGTAASSRDTYAIDVAHGADNRAVTNCLERGRAVAAGYRVTRASELARSAMSGTKEHVQS